MEFLWKFGEPIISKLVEKLMNFALSKNDKDTFDSLVSNIRLLCAKASDVDEEINKAELSGKKKRKREVHTWLEQVQSLESEFHSLENRLQREGFVREFIGGGEAAKLEARVRGLVEQSRYFGELVLNAYDQKGEKLLIGELVGEEFDKNLKNILHFFLVEKVSSIGIHGMGGVGKTALAKHVNNRLLERNKESVAWITVPQEFRNATLQDEVAKFVGLDLSDEENEDKRASILHRVLSRRKNLILILDDVWKDIDLKKLGDPLSIEGCKLLITTRLQSVCRRINCKKIVTMKTLSENEAWNLFVETLGRRASLTPRVHKIAENMIKVCGGLPLGIITIAGSMKGETEFHVWRDAWAELRRSIMGQQEMEERVYKVLKYSFDRLDRDATNTNGYTKLQLCFLHCSLYPEDAKIDRKELIKKFIVEGYLGEEESRKELYIQGHAVLDRLASACLLEKLDHNKVTMHDMVRAMALKITQGRTKVIVGHYSLKEIPREKEWSKDLERISLMNNGITTIQDGRSPNCPTLSTLILENNPLEFIPDSFFANMPTLTILDLSKTRIRKLPNSLSETKALRALLLTKCYNLEFVPYLGKLKELRELDLTRTAIHEVPRGMEELVNLTYLSLNVTRNLRTFPKGFFLNFPRLQCLYLPYHVEAPVDEIEELNHLDEFHGRVKDTNDCNRLKRNKPSLDHCIKVGLDKRYLYREFIGYNQLEFLEYDFNKRREDDDTTVLAQGIRHLNLQRCTGLSACLVEILPRLNNPTSMESLSIRHCHEVERLMNLSLNHGAPRRSSSLSSPPLSSFSSLSVLNISFCKNMKKLGLQARQLPNMKEIKVEFCEATEEVIESGESRVVALPKLECLHLVGLPKLKTVCDAAMICGSIQRVTLKKCRALAKLPLVFGQPPDFDSRPASLREIRLRWDEKEWWEEMELGHPSHHSLLQQFVRFEVETESNNGQP
ncbi:probable disease resistance protein At4g27220 [Andrographis paniculata]|uniref:probable disease resistance protein At4g27220 n=1 Tax=Andrographis paniculata TaxID=175694 RepID=UPI0021E7B58E|nr:probable disease resistance protein At4g27220 [Andrographis paniculata]